MSQISKFDFDEGVLVKGKGLEGITFILNYAKLCVGRCKALRGRLQCFAWTIAMLCVDDCNALRESWTELAQKSLSYSG